MTYSTAAPTTERPSAASHHELRSHLESLARIHRVPGAQLAVHTGTHLVSLHTGTADALRNTAFTARTAVPLGSVTKVATATAVLLLADDGDLDLDEPVSDLLPDLPGGLTDVTTRHLLSHTARPPHRARLRQRRRHHRLPLPLDRLDRPEHPLHTGHRILVLQRPATSSPAASCPK